MLTKLTQIINQTVYRKQCQTVYDEWCIKRCIKRCQLSALSGCKNHIAKAEDSSKRFDELSRFDVFTDLG